MPVNFTSIKLVLSTGKCIYCIWEMSLDPPAALVIVHYFHRFHPCINYQQPPGPGCSTGIRGSSSCSCCPLLLLRLTSISNERNLTLLVSRRSLSDRYNWPTLIIIRSVRSSLCYKCLRFLWPFNDGLTKQATKQMPMIGQTSQMHLTHNWYSPSHH